MRYSDFINSKSRTFESSGIDINKSDLNSGMFEFQKDIVRWALKKESYYNLALENADKAELDYVIEGRTNKF